MPLPVSASASPRGNRFLRSLSTAGALLVAVVLIDDGGLTLLCGALLWIPMTSGATPYMELIGQLILLGTAWA